jgi:hypothetical protein
MNTNSTTKPKEEYKREVKPWVHKDINTEEEFNDLIASGPAMICFHAPWNGPSVLIGEYWEDEICLNAEVTTAV